MHVIELYQLTEWINKEIKEANILQKYQNLHSILQQNTKPNQPKQPFDAQKNDLVEALDKVPLNRLSIDQIDFLKRLNLAPYIGNEGIDSIEDLLYRNVIDIATSASSLQQIVSNFSQALNKSEQIFNSLKDCIDIAPPDFEEVLIRVSFAGNAAIENIADLKGWGSTWYDIARGIAMAHGSAPEDVKILGAARGSLIIELGVAYLIAGTTSKIILSTLDVAERVMNIRKKAEEIRNLKLKNTKLAEELEKEANQEKLNGIKDITGKIVSELKLKSDGEGDKIVAIEDSIKKLVDFVDRGGSVDFVITEDTVGEDIVDAKEQQKQQKMRKELRNSFEEIRRLESKIKLLEESNSESQN